ncbi:MAG TPA: cobyric acid synthase [Desulfobulbus sp.]|nr:cobyric acid synthase [Desulfobulbus sp.]
MSGHGGNIRQLAARCGCRPGDILDFSANINPLGPPECLRGVISRAVHDLVHYPDPDCSLLVRSLAARHRLDPDEILAGNGTSELLFAAVRALPGTRAVLPVPSYVDYQTACSRAGLDVQPLYLRPEKDFVLQVPELEETLRDGDLVILGQPNNPTGRLVDREALLALCRRQPGVTFLVDEAFAGFVPGYAGLACRADNLVVLCSLTKLYGFPGLRLGFLAARATLCDRVRRQLAPWSVNSLAQAVGIHCLDDPDYLDATRQLVDEERAALADMLGSIGEVRVVPSAANFLLLHLQARVKAPELAERLLLEHRIAIRSCEDYLGLDDRWLRVAVRNGRDNRRLAEAMAAVLRPGERKVRRSARTATPALMLLGTGSDVGKSVLVAGLCRVLLQDGVRVAPFKAQNMSLNSYVTRDGGEMGRAQVVQAQACRLDPDVRMNPVLLKPSSDVGSQIIVCGRPVGNMKVIDYVRYKETAWQEVCRAYDSLAAEFDVVILEGAGSPGEVNLKSHDIVNMRMARHAGAPSLLVGDIDRGGVYASFIGHWEVMAHWEQDLLAGFVVNRFRGDASLLADAHDYLRRRTGLPTLGVVPFLQDLGLPQEDSVSFKAGLYESRRPGIPHVDIACIDLPHISNFTDIEPFLDEPDVHVRIVRTARDLGRPDAIILPGSKNVLADLAALRQQGLDDAIIALAGQGCEIVGICGGFQMLGHTLADPLGLEGTAGSLDRGLGILDMVTELAADKTLVRRSGIHLPSGCPVHGYEIHHGVSRGRGGELIRFSDGATCGLEERGGLVWGSYLHGIFDADTFRRWFIDRLRQRKGLEKYRGRGAVYDLEPALDRLADVLRHSLDMDAIRHLLHL